MEMSPAMLKISEKPRNHHFLPRKSMFELRKNSTYSTFFELDAQGLAPLFAAQYGIKDHPRNEHCCEQIGEQAEGQRETEATDRAAAHKNQNDGRNNRGDVGVHDGDPGAAESLVHGCGRALVVAQLLADALKDE